MWLNMRRVRSNFLTFFIPKGDAESVTNKDFSVINREKSYLIGQYQNVFVTLLPKKMHQHVSEEFFLWIKTP